LILSQLRSPFSRSLRATRVLRMVFSLFFFSVRSPGASFDDRAFLSLSSATGTAVPVFFFDPIPSLLRFLFPPPILEPVGFFFAISPCAVSHLLYAFSLPRLLTNRFFLPPESLILFRPPPFCSPSYLHQCWAFMLRFRTSVRRKYYSLYPLPPSSSSPALEIFH